MITAASLAVTRWSWNIRYTMAGHWKGDNHPSWFIRENNMPYRSYALIQQGKWYAQR